MDITVNNFYLLEPSGKPIIVSENYEENKGITEDIIFQNSLSRVGGTLSEGEVYKLEYKDIFHYVTIQSGKIVVVGFKLDAGSKQEFLTSITPIIEDIDFKKYNIIEYSSEEDFEKRSDELINEILDQIEESFDPYLDLKIELKLSEAIRP